MAEIKESYWSRHHTGLMQCVLGLYCAVFATWEHFYPRVATTSAAPQSVSAAMTNSYSMPFWLWAGIVGLALSVIVPAILKMIRNWRPVPPELGVTIDRALWGPRPEDVKDVTKRVRKTLEANGEMEVSTYVLRDPFKGEAKQLWVTYSITKTVEVPEEHPLPRRLTLAALNNSFTPLQLETFRLAEDLRIFLKDLGPRPDADWQSKNSSDSEKLAERSRLQSPWVSKLMHVYAREFAPKVKNLMHRLGETGLRVWELSPYAESAGSELQILVVAHALDSLATELSYQDVPVDDYDMDTAKRYQNMGTEEMRRFLTKYQDAGPFVEAALKDMNRRHESGKKN